MNEAAPQLDITDINSIEFRSRQMKQSVDYCYESKLYMPGLCLIAAYIDGLSKGNKDEYLSNVEKYFPGLAEELGANEFYSKYRNGVLHEFSPKKGFGIGGAGYLFNGKYIAEIESLTILNIDRLKEDFDAWVKSIRDDENLDSI